MLTPALFLLTTACAPPPYTPPADDTSGVDTSGGETGDSGESADTTPPDTDPHIEFTWPPAASTLVGCVVATVNVTNFEIVDPNTKGHEDPVDGEGHWHLLHPAGPGTYSACYRPYCVGHFEELGEEPVQDFLRARLVDNDHHDIFDDNGLSYETSLEMTFLGGACAEALGGEGYGGGNDTAWDTGGDTGDTASSGHGGHIAG